MSDASFQQPHNVSQAAASTIQLDGKEAFVHAPRPRRSQPAAAPSTGDLTDDDYATSTEFTTKGGRPLTGGGYRRSRSEAARLKRNLRYGQYLEVPKGKHAIFAPSASRQLTVIASVTAIFIVVAVVVLAVWLWPR